MVTKDEALKLALEALKQIDEAMPFPVAKLAQKVIREALEQPEQEITDSEMFKIRSAYRKGFEHGMEQAPHRKPLTGEGIDKLADMHRKE